MDINPEEKLDEKQNKFYQLFATHDEEDLLTKRVWLVTTKVY